MQEYRSEFQIGNWVLYLPERNYCTIKSISPELTLQGVLHEYNSTFEHLGKIEITEDKLQVLGFEVHSRVFIKHFNDELSVALIFFPTGIQLLKNDEEFCEVQFIHEVQNAYYNITGELLKGNLYGVQER